MRPANIKNRVIDIRFHTEINTLSKINNIIEFKKSLNKKLKSPFFKSSLLFSKNKFKNIKFSSNSKLFNDFKLDNVLALILVKIIKQSSNLKNYVLQKNLYEKYIFDGKYEEALQTIEDIGDEFGYSYWYIEAKLSTFSLMNKHDKSLEFYKKLSNLKISEVELRDLDLIFERTQSNAKTERITYSLDSLIDGLSIDGALDGFIIDFMHRFDCSKQYNATKILSYFWQCNIIDIYNVLLRLSFSNSIVFDDIDNSLKDDYITIANETNDIKLLNYVYNNNQYDNEFKNNYLNICDLYIEGKFEKCIEQYEINFIDKKNIFSLYELYTNSLINTEKKIESENTVFNIIICNSLSYSTFNRDKLKKIFYMLNHIDALQIYCLRENKRIINFDSSSINNTYKFFEFTSTSINPFNIKNFYENSISSKISHSDLINKFDFTIPVYRNIKRIGDHYFHAKNFSTAIETYLNIETIPKHMKDEINNKIILCYIHNNELHNACKYICNLFFKNELNIERVDCYKILEVLEECEPSDDVIIEIPIAIYIIASQVNDEQVVSLYLDDFLDQENITLPSELEPLNDKYKFLMHKVCNLNTLESLHIVRNIYKSSPERILDRMKILSKLDEYETNEIRLEIKFLTTQYSSYLCTKNIGKGKININFEVLSKIIKKEKKNYIESMLEAYKIEKDTFNFDISEIKNQKDTLLYNTVNDFLCTVRDLYTLDGKYGLDYQLNTKIRHNGIVPSIRSIFESEGVLCNRQDDIYLDNELFGQECKSLLWDSIYKDSQKKIKEFSRSIDITLYNLKTVYMQVMTGDILEKTNHSCLFKFSFTENDISNYMIFLKSDKTHDEHIRYALEILKEKTNNCLRLSKVLLSEALPNTFYDDIKKLQNDLKNKKCKKYNAALSLVTNDLKSKMEDISEWLSFTEVVGENFGLDVAIYEAENFTKTIFPSVKYNININIINTACIIFNGKHLDSFVHMFILLFENAFKNRNNDNDLTINIKITTSWDNHVEISISNNYKKISSNTITNINSKINTQDYLINANKEEDSGLFKVKKILEIEFQCENKIELSFDERFFNFNVILNISTLTV